MKKLCCKSHQAPCQEDPYPPSWCWIFECKMGLEIFMIHQECHGEAILTNKATCTCVCENLVVRLSVHPSGQNDGWMDRQKYGMAQVEKWWRNDQRVRKVRVQVLDLFLFVLYFTWT